MEDIKKFIVFHSRNNFDPECRYIFDSNQSRDIIEACNCMALGSYELGLSFVSSNKEPCDFIIKLLEYGIPPDWKITPSIFSSAHLCNLIYRQFEKYINNVIGYFQFIQVDMSLGRIVKQVSSLPPTKLLLIDLSLFILLRKQLAIMYYNKNNYFQTNKTLYLPRLTFDQVYYNFSKPFWYLPAIQINIDENKWNTTSYEALTSISNRIVSNARKSFFKDKTALSGLSSKVMKLLCNLLYICPRESWDLIKLMINSLSSTTNKVVEQQTMSTDKHNNDNLENQSLTSVLNIPELDIDGQFINEFQEFEIENKSELRNIDFTTNLSNTIDFNSYFKNIIKGQNFTRSDTITNSNSNKYNGYMQDPQIKDSNYNITSITLATISNTNPEENNYIKEYQIQFQWTIKQTFNYAILESIKINN